MNIKMLNKIIKDEKLKSDEQVMLKISFQDEDGKFQTRIVEAESYVVNADGLLLTGFIHK